MSEASDTILREVARAGERSEKSTCARGRRVRRGGPRGNATAAFAGGREVVPRDPCASRSSSGMARSGPRRSPPRQKFDPPPRAPPVRYVSSRDCGLLTSACVLPVCPRPAGGMSSPLGAMVAGYSRSFSGAVLNPPTSVPAPVALAQGGFLIAAWLFAQHQPSPRFACLQRRLKADSALAAFVSPHATSPRDSRNLWGLRIFTTLGAYIPFPPGGPARSSVPQPCVLSFKAERCVPAPDRAPMRPPRRDARGLSFFKAKGLCGAPTGSPPVEPMLTLLCRAHLAGLTFIKYNGGRPPHVRQGSPHTVVLRRRQRVGVHRPQRRRGRGRVRGLQDLRLVPRTPRADVGHRDRDVLLHPPVRQPSRGGALPGAC